MPSTENIKNDWNTPRDVLEQEAEKGNPESTLQILDLILNGNAGNSLTRIQKAAEQGYAPAQNDLGSRYYSGDGVVQDINQAIKWW